MKSKLGLSQPVSNQDVFDNYGYDENDLYDERVDINNPPNLHVELSHDVDSDLDSIGVKKSKTVEKQKDLSKKLMFELSIRCSYHIDDSLNMCLDLNYICI